MSSVSCTSLNFFGTFDYERKMFITKAIEPEQLGAARAP